MISLLTSALTSSKPALIRSAGSTLFNMLRVLVKDSSIHVEENDLLCVASGINRALNMLLQGGNNKGLIKLLITCFGGIVVVARKSFVSEMFESFIVIEAPEIFSKISTAESREVLGLLSRD